MTGSHLDETPLHVHREINCQKRKNGKPLFNRAPYLSAREVLELLQAKKGYGREELPSERTMRDILNRMNYRLKRIQKGRPLKKPGRPMRSSPT